MDGGWKSTAVGLASYRSLRHHHNPTTMEASHSFMDQHASELHKSTWRMGKVMRDNGPKVFQIETTLNTDTFPQPFEFLSKREWEWNAKDRALYLGTAKSVAKLPARTARKIFHGIEAPHQMTSIQCGEVEAVHKVTTQHVYDQQLVEVEGQTDILTMGIPYICPYNVHSIMNPILVMCTGLGYFFNLYRGKPLVREGAPITGDVIWSCTTCRACEDICPVNIQHLDLLLEIRKHLVLMEASFPPEMQDTFISLENQSNPWGFGSDTRADWAKGLDIPLVCDRPDAELLFYVGCAGSFDDRGKQVSQAMARVLKKAGIDFAILGEEERCNGDMARRAGNEYLAQTMIRENADVLNRYRPRKILTGCPHCYNTLKNEYPRFGARFEVLHASELLLQLLRQGRLEVKTGLREPVAFHDSCYLGRWNGLYDAPRAILKILDGGGGLREMRRSRDKGLCCGAGGGRMFMEEKIGKRINAERVDDLIASGAGMTAAACPFCITMLRDGLADRGSRVGVKDIVELVDQATA